MDLSTTPSVVTIRGDVDVNSGDALKKIERDLRMAESLVVECSGLEFADTTFLRFLMQLRKHANKTERTAIRLTGVSPRFRRVLEITGLSRCFVLQ
jgi:anti-anti-sigma factor